MELLKGFNVEDGKEYIYLVMVEYKDKTLLKIGYTKTLNGRMDTYELHNPDIQLLKIREGTRNLENYMHRKFEKYAYPKRKEWFYYNEEIINGFNVLEENNFLDINQLKNRIYNFLKPKSIDSLKKMYYEKYHEEIENERIDEEDLDTLITNTFFFINEKIKNFILSFDYSEIPLELDLSTHYQIIIPNPTSSVDISINLEQILGKQKLKESSWKNRANMFIKTTRGANKVPWEEFKERLDEKERKTMLLLDAYRTASGKHDLAENYQKVAKTYHYKDDYVAVNEHAGSDLVPVFNKLMQVSEIRAFEMQQTDYADRFTVFNAVSEKGLAGDIEKPVKELAEEFKGQTDEVNRLKFIVSLSEVNLTKEELFSFFSLIPDKYFNYYDILGFDGIKSCKCQESYVKRKINDIKGNSMIDKKIKEEIYRLFKVGNRYVKADIKSTLKMLYDRLGYQKTAKASDLEQYFEVKGILTSDKKAGFELLSKK